MKQEAAPSPAQPRLRARSRTAPGLRLGAGCWAPPRLSPPGAPRAWLLRLSQQQLGREVFAVPKRLPQSWAWPLPRSASSSGASAGPCPGVRHGDGEGAVASPAPGLVLSGIAAELGKSCWK